MRVYDVVSAKDQLNEEYDVVPRGNPPNKLFVVIDPESGKELGSYRTPGQARTAAKDANAKVQAAADKKVADAEKAEKDKLDKIKSTNRFYRNLKLSAGGLGILFAGYSIVGSVDTHVTEQTELYKSYRAGNFGTMGSPEAVKKYEERSKVIYGAWVSSAAATILASGAQAVIAAKIINGIRAARTAGALAAGSATLGIGALIAYLLGEAASYGAMWLINRPSTIEALIEYTWNAPAISLAFATASKFNPDVSLDDDVQKDLKYAMGMSPRDKAGVEKSKQDYTSAKPTPAAPAPTASASAPAASSSAPSSSSSQSEPPKSEPTRKNWAAGLD
jgi:hypothetical protein